MYKRGVVPIPPPLEENFNSLGAREFFKNVKKKRPEKCRILTNNKKFFNPYFSRVF